MAGRKMMTKEVTSTSIKVAMIEVVGGQPKMVTLPEVTMIGNVSLENAQRILNKEYGQPVTILEVVTDTKVYEMAVEEFIKHAHLKEEQLTVEG